MSLFASFKRVRIKFVTASEGDFLWRWIRPGMSNFLAGVLLEARRV